MKMTTAASTVFVSFVLFDVQPYTTFSERCPEPIQTERTRLCDERNNWVVAVQGS
jgi:hypothetical protein